MTRYSEPDAPVNAEEYLGSAPPALEVPEARTKIRERVISGGRHVVVLDADPTGTRDMRGLPVPTGPTYSELRRALEQPTPIVYVPTGSSTLDEPDAVILNRRLGRRLRRAASDSGARLAVLSRGDPNLRGHFPAETDALEREMGGNVDGIILCPCSFEDGRVTVGDVQWVRQGEKLVPVALAGDASDATFGYSSSHLPSWVEDKTGGRVPADGVSSIGLRDIREGGRGRVAGLLGEARDAVIIVVNAACPADLEVFVLGLLDAEAAGKTFLCRTGSSLVRVRGGIPEEGPETVEDPKGGR